MAHELKVIILVSLPQGTDVSEKYGAEDIGHLLMGGYGLLDHMIAADRRTEIRPDKLLAGANTLDECHPLRYLPIGGTEQQPPIGTGGAENPLQLNAGDDIRILAISELLLKTGIKLIEAGG